MQHECRKQKILYIHVSSKNYKCSPLIDDLHICNQPAVKSHCTLERLSLHGLFVSLPERKNITTGLMKDKKSVTYV